MQILLSMVCLGALCGGWVALQRWIARVDPDLGRADHCSGCGNHLCEIEKNDPWREDRGGGPRC